MKDRCPPHKFVAAWSSDDDHSGVIFCVYCGDVLPLAPAQVDAPAIERLTPEEQVQLSRDYGEPT